MKTSAPDTATVTMVVSKGKLGKTRKAVRIIDMLGEEVIRAFALQLRGGLSVSNGIRKALMSLAGR